MASLANYNFSLEYQKGKDNTVADFLSRMENCLPKEEVEEALRRVTIPAPGVKAMLDNADTPIAERAEMGNNVPPIRACLAETLSACPVKYTTLQVVDWLVLKNGLLYHKTCLTRTGEDLWHFIVPKSHQGIA